MKWTELKLPSTKELTAREIGKFQKIIPSIDANELSFDELRIAFKYCLNVLESAAIRQIVSSQTCFHHFNVFQFNFPFLLATTVC